MDLSTASPAIAAGLLQVQGSIGTLGYDERNEHGKYNYVSADKFYVSIRPLLNEAGLIIVADLEDMEVISKGGDKFSLKCLYGFYFVHRDGGPWFGPFRRGVVVPYTGAQSSGAADTYAEKQFLRSVFKVATGDADADADGFSTKPQRAKPREVRSAPAAYSGTVSEQPASAELAKSARAAAMRGRSDLNAFWKKLTATERNQVKTLVMPDANGNPGSLTLLADEVDARKAATGDQDS